jgi:mannose-6-phosphate isomerase-like protein (cupin superfamily)
MKRLAVPVVFVLASAVPCLAQDPAKAHPNQYHVLVDNARVRVLHVAVPAGAKNALHDHPDHVAVMLTDSSIRFTGADGTPAETTSKKGEALYIQAGRHAGENTGKGALEAIVVELKGAPGTATLPADRAGMDATTLVDNARVRVVRAAAAPDFSEPAGSKHDYDQVVIPLSATTGMSVSVDGKTKTSWKSGEALFIGRGVAHESKNTGGKPIEFVIVAVK